MKATAESLSEVVVAEKGWAAVYADLIKARLTFLVVLTTLVGFYLGSPSPVNYWLMLHAVLGTAMVASGAAALNQLLEREHDVLGEFAGALTGVYKPDELRTLRDEWD